MEVMRFWCEKRQAPDGQFGGGWGDDVEMWRKWTPILLGFKIRYLGRRLKTAEDRVSMTSL